MSAKDDGGPAYPTTPVSHGYAHDSTGSGTGASPGISIRDYFAAAAMQGDLAAQSFEAGEWPDAIIGVLAIRAYAIADAMLEARKQ